MTENEKLTLELLKELDEMTPEDIERVRDEVLENAEIKQHETTLEFMKLLFEVIIKKCFKVKRVY